MGRYLIVIFASICLIFVWHGALSIVCAYLWLFCFEAAVLFVSEKRKFKGAHPRVLSGGVHPGFFGRH